MNTKSADNLYFFEELFFIIGKEGFSNFLALILFFVIAAIFDIITIASVIPVISGLFGDSVSNFFFYDFLFDFFGVKSHENRILFAVSICAGLVIFSALLRVCSVVLIAKFSSSFLALIPSKLMAHYLARNYEISMTQSTVDMVKNIVSEADVFVNNILFSLATVVSQFMVAVMAGVLLFVVSAQMAILAVLFFVLAYGVTFYLLRNWLSVVAQQRADTNQERFTIASENLRCLREAKLHGLELMFSRRFDSTAARYASSTMLVNVLSVSPRFLVEAILILGVLLIMVVQVFMVDGGGGLSDSLPLLGVFAFGALRILPAAQGIYAGLSSIKYGIQAFRIVSAELRAEAASRQFKSAQAESDEKEFFSDFKALSVVNVSYAYPGRSDFALKDVTLRIPANSFVGVVGQSGSGKTTLLDICLGLLSPAHGFVGLETDDGSVKELPLWGRNLAYVAQDFVILQASIAENVAFGVRPSDIDETLVQRLLCDVGLGQFIVSLSDGIWTSLHGLKQGLSGGQRQRLAIARALYLKPKILILDEWTSALDVKTGGIMLDLINGLRSNTTIIMVTHRADLVAGCDLLIELNNGEIVQRIERFPVEGVS